MIRVRISKEFIEDGLRTGASHQFKIDDGIPAGFKLVHAEYKDKTLSLFFSENESVQDKAITASKITE